VYLSFFIHVYLFSLPFLFVFRDDCVTCHIGAYDDLSADGEA